MRLSSFLQLKHPPKTRCCNLYHSQNSRTTIQRSVPFPSSPLHHHRLKNYNYRDYQSQHYIYNYKDNRISQTKITTTTTSRTSITSMTTATTGRAKTIGATIRTSTTPNWLPPHLLSCQVHGSDIGLAVLRKTINPGIMAPELHVEAILMIEPICNPYSRWERSVILLHYTRIQWQGPQQIVPCRKCDDLQDVCRKSPRTPQSCSGRVWAGRLVEPIHLLPPPYPSREKVRFSQLTRYDGPPVTLEWHRQLSMNWS